MKVRGAGLGFDVNVCTCSSPILCVVERSLDLELLNGIRSRNRDPRSTERSDLGDIGAITVRIHAVKHEIIVAATRTIGPNLLTSGPQLSCVHDIRVCSGRQAENLGEVPINERQFDNSFLIDDSSQSGVLGLKKREGGANYDLLLCARKRELNIQPAHLGDLNLKAIQYEWFESCRAHRQVILAGRQELDRKIPLPVRREIALFSGALAADVHCSTWYQCSTGVAHGASDRSGIGCLAVHRQSAEREHNGPEQSAGRVQRHVLPHLVPPSITAAGWKDESGSMRKNESGSI